MTSYLIYFARHLQANLKSLGDNVGPTHNGESPQCNTKGHRLTHPKEVGHRPVGPNCKMAITRSHFFYLLPTSGNMRVVVRGIFAPLRMIV